MQRAPDDIIFKTRADIVDSRGSQNSVMDKITLAAQAFRHWVLIVYSGRYPINTFLAFAPGRWPGTGRPASAYQRCHDTIAVRCRCIRNGLCILLGGSDHRTVIIGSDTFARSVPNNRAVTARPGICHCVSQASVGSRRRASWLPFYPLPHEPFQAFGGLLAGTHKAQSFCFNGVNQAWNF